MKQVKVTAYQTSDGKQFLNYEDADKHEQKLGRESKIRQIMHKFFENKQTLSEDYRTTFVDINDVLEFIIQHGDDIAKIFDWTS